MSIPQKLENDYKNVIKSIKNMSNGVERDLAIGSLVADLGNRSISAVSRILNLCRVKVKSCFEVFINGKQLSLEFRGRKKITDKYPNLKNDIEKVIEKYKNVDSHFKTETLYVSINPKTVIDELILNYNYPENFACYNTIKNILNDMGYKLHRIPKSKVLDKVPETDKIFENVNNELESALETSDEISVISIDDKATKKIGNISDNGKTTLNIEALDHDTHFDYSMKPFGILDLKTNETFVTCTPYSSTAEFKVKCIEDYINEKNKIIKQKKLIIFLDNGPENSGRRKLWLKKLVELSIKYDIVIDLVYYPPYHSKYNKIERFWARLQMFWNGVIIDTTDKLLDILNKVTWNNVKCKGLISFKNYKKGILVSDYDMETNVNPHIIREQGLEKWSIIITPWSN